jgi:hypothetical protein
LKADKIPVAVWATIISLLCGPKAHALELGGFLDLRASDSNAATSWVYGGLGKQRTDKSHNGLLLGQADLIVEGEVADTVSANLTLSAVSEHRSFSGETFTRRRRGRVGVGFRSESQPPCTQGKLSIDAVCKPFAHRFPCQPLCSHSGGFMQTDTPAGTISGFRRGVDFEVALMTPPNPPKRPLGFVTSDEKSTKEKG